MNQVTTGDIVDIMRRSDFSADQLIRFFDRVERPTAFQLLAVLEKAATEIENGLPPRWFNDEVVWALRKISQDILASSDKAYEQVSESKKHAHTILFDSFLSTALEAPNCREYNMSVDFLSLYRNLHIAEGNMDNN